MTTATETKTVWLTFSWNSYDRKRPRWVLIVTDRKHAHHLTIPHYLEDQFDQALDQAHALLRDDYGITDVQWSEKPHERDGTPVLTAVVTE